MSHETTNEWMYQITDIQVKSYEPRSGEPFTNRNKIYMWPDNETISENLVNRRTRPYTTYKKDLIPQLMEWLEKNMPNYYKEIKDSKWGWRQNCGCSMCPCSPGFVSDAEGYVTIHIKFI
jgi:hypothetical protein